LPASLKIQKADEHRPFFELDLGETGAQLSKLLANKERQK
jgi:hypothetical protein